MEPGNQYINWSELAGDFASRVRPETAAKYFPRNPLRRLLINNFLSRIGETLGEFAWQSVLDVGCGEGFVDYYLLLGYPERAITGVDPDPAALAVARHINPSLDYQSADGRRLPFADHSFDSALCLEVLEHLSDYDQVIAEVKRVSRGPCLFSVPAFPFYQAANFLIGKNWSRLGEHPDHLVRFSRARLRSALSPHFSSVSIQLSFPWLIALGKE